MDQGDIGDWEYIRVSYDNHLKIQKIHEILLRFFKHYTLERIESELTILNKNTDGNQKKIDLLENLRNNFHKREIYISSAESLITQYNNLDKTGNKIKIFNLGKKTVEDLETQNKKKAIIETFLELASEYIPIEKDSKNVDVARCPSCSEPLSNFEEFNESNICDCGYQITNYYVVSEIQTTTKSNYEDRNNFIKGMKRKQGKTQPKLPEDLIPKLDSYFEQVRGPRRSKILKQNTNEHGEKEGTTMEMLRLALHDIGYSSLYNEIDYIMHIYWGWTLLDFSHLEEEMLKFYDETQEEYELIPGKERSASLNMNFRQYEQLRGLDFPVRRERYIFQESEKSLQIHQEYWKIMCEKSGRKYVPFFS